MIFNFTFLHEYKDYVSENYTVKVILPEGATDIKVRLKIRNNNLCYRSTFL